MRTRSCKNLQCNKKKKKRKKKKQPEKNNEANKTTTTTTSRKKWCQDILKLDENEKSDYQSKGGQQIRN